MWELPSLLAKAQAADLAPPSQQEPAPTTSALPILINNLVQAAPEQDKNTKSKDKAGLQGHQPQGKATWHVGMLEVMLNIIEKRRRERSFMSCREKAAGPDSKLQQLAGQQEEQSGGSLTV